MGSGARDCEEMVVLDGQWNPARDEFLEIPEGRRAFDAGSIVMKD